MCLSWDQQLRKIRYSGDLKQWFSKHKKLPWKSKVERRLFFECFFSVKIIVLVRVYRMVDFALNQGQTLVKHQSLDPFWYHLWRQNFRTCIYRGQMVLQPWFTIPTIPHLAVLDPEKKSLNNFIFPTKYSSSQKV